MTRSDRWRRLAEAPALHFFLLGLCLFAASRLAAPSGETPAGALVEIPHARVVEAVERFEVEIGRAPTDADRASIRQRLVDDEVLFRYAVSIGLHRRPIPARRLADIGSFVDGSSGGDRARQAERAVELGLHRGDFVTRRLLVDAARRMILRVGQARAPSPDEVSEYLRRHEERFRGDDEIRISHILLRGAGAEDRAEDLLGKLRSRSTTPAEAAALSDPSPVPLHLPLLDAAALERRFGRRFRQQLTGPEPPSTPTGSWAHPLTSRFGAHLVYVHERRPGEIANLRQVEDEIRTLLRLRAGERWLEERLRQLRSEFPVAIRPAGGDEADM